MAETSCETTLTQDIKLNDLKFVKQLAGTEDILWGLGSITQLRNGQAVTITAVNADAIPYDSTRSVKDVIDAILAKYPL